ncbi:MAG: hypothetical protein COB36_04440 [Alphaproteobacteria bacterium]|nr:MAG: hypothetical protein COB36_04440 [Alphaproteobacteria bacterium]
MTLNFFTSENGFQKSLIDPSSSIGTKKDYTTSLKREEFHSSRSKSSDLKQSEQNEKFADMMNSLKKKTTNSDKTAPATEKKIEAEIRADIALKSAEISLFKTKEAALSIELSAVQSDVKAQDTDVNLANIVALNAEIQRLIEEQTQNNGVKGDIQGDIVVTTETKSEKIESIFALLASFLNHGGDEDIKDGEPDVAFISVLAQIQELAQSEDAIAITSGLTPEQLTALQDYMQDYVDGVLEQRDQDVLEALAAQWVSLNPPAKETVKETLKETVKEALQDSKNQEMQIIRTKADTPKSKEQQTQARFEGRYDARYDGNSETARTNTDDKNTTDFKATLKNADAKSSGATATTAKNDNTQSAGQRFLQTTGLATQGQTSPADPTATTPATVQSPLQSSMTNVITQSQSATQAHPATQMVSATIQKAVKAGEDTTIKLKLNPPELGRVEVKMSIDKDNVTKIVLTAEKPETYMMLKQDAEILERALSNAGLDTNGDLSFELASEDHDFGQDSKQGRSKQNNNSNGLPDEDIIETSMDWQVDPQTGQMHYNVLV